MSKARLIYVAVSAMIFIFALLPALHFLPGGPHDGAEI